VVALFDPPTAPSDRPFDLGSTQPRDERAATDIREPHRDQFPRGDRPKSVRPTIQYSTNCSFELAGTAPIRSCKRHNSHPAWVAMSFHNPCTDKSPRMHLSALSQLPYARSAGT
jgi:hypothetical protein